MKYEIGDKIIVLHSKEEGVVVDFISTDIAMIEVEGVRFPVYLDQIDFPYFEMFSKKSSGVQQKKYIDQIKPEKPEYKFKTGEGVH
ncbi:MAG: hypothetical protein FGM46_06710, partial [Ferruginibacter sp.]|nr:hypothetical protein [Ferruginibacter sp.]